MIALTLQMFKFIKLKPADTGPPYRLPMFLNGFNISVVVVFVLVSRSKQNDGFMNQTSSVKTRCFHKKTKTKKTNTEH